MHKTETNSDNSGKLNKYGKTKKLIQTVIKWKI